jgi:hypothetical protein
MNIGDITALLLAGDEDSIEGCEAGVGEGT